MSFITGNGNGLIAPPDIFPSGPTRPAFYLTRANDNGDVDISGSVTVEGTVFTDFIQSLSASDPIYITNPDELGGAALASSAVVIEGGANRVDISQSQVTLALVKPITSNQVDHVAGEQVGSWSSWGKDAAAAARKISDIRSVTTNPSATNMQTRLNIALATGASDPVTLLQIDTSLNGVRAIGGATFQVVDLSDSTVFAVPFNYTAEVATGGGAAMPLDATTSTFTPRYTGTYAFEMTYLFATAANGGQVNDDNVFGFRVSGAGNDYGAVVAGKAITLPASGNALPYTISSLHQLTAGTAYTVTYIYQGTAGSKGGASGGAAAGGYLLEANLV